jgi:hypothetical protein
MAWFHREAISTRLKELDIRGRSIIVDENPTEWQKSTHDKLIECLIEIACDYIEWGRHRRDGKVMSKLEKRYMFTEDFYTCDNPRAWLEAHRTSDDHELILYVLEHYEHMESSMHVDKMTYVLGALCQDHEFIFS